MEVDVDWIIGKAYKTRDGHKAVLVDIYNHDSGVELKFRHEDTGYNTWHYNDGQMHGLIPGLDIIAELADEPAKSENPAHVEEPLDLAALAAQHGIKITVKVGEMSIIYDGRK